MIEQTFELRFANNLNDITLFCFQFIHQLRLFFNVKISMDANIYLTI